MLQYLAYLFRLYAYPLVAFTISSFLLAFIALVGFGDLYAHRYKDTQPIPQLVPTTKPHKASEVLLQTLPDSSIDISELIHRTSDRDAMPIEEITYETRREHDLPVELRNASFALTSDYTSIRHYLDNVIHDQPNLTLEAISCTRDDISSRDVNCSITLTAIQRIGANTGGASHAN